MNSPRVSIIMGSTSNKALPEVSSSHMVSSITTRTSLLAADAAKKFDSLHDESKMPETRVKNRNKFEDFMQ